MDLLLAIPQDIPWARKFAAEVQLALTRFDAPALGQIGIFADGTLPEGWLTCDGAAFDREAFAWLLRIYPSGLLPSYTSPFAGTVVAIRAN